MMILNPKAKESQEQALEKHKEWVANALAGKANQHLNTRLEIIQSPLWQSIRELLPEGRHDEVLMSLQKVYLSNTKINLDEDNLDSAMVWMDTVQGHQYWADLHLTCRENDI